MIIGSILNFLGLVLLLLSLRKDQFQKYLLAGSVVVSIAGVVSACISMGV